MCIKYVFFRINVTFITLKLMKYPRLDILKYENAFFTMNV